ncbi:metallophosphoesterase [Asanoa sp. NPDC049573]|uniref:metallophosphoesterase family protein n=1 Tax=Asanoa sp. NPDC049573 TaxID=3155396 RepID=UPI003412CB5B
MKRRNVVRLAIAAGLVVVAAVAAGASAGRSSVEGDGYGNPGGVAPREAWAWTQLVADPAHPGQVTQARLVTPDATCPFIEITTPAGRERHHMVAESVVSQYPTDATVCTWRVPLNATKAQIDRKTSQVRIRPHNSGVVPLPTWGSGKRPENIAVIGDTGCRIPSGGTHQVCDHVQSWPFPEVASSAAKRPDTPDLVIHTGDYIYRSRPGDEPTRYCGDQSTNERTWGCLVADLFEPAQSLIAAAPFVFVRGNHETCDRNGAVWFRYQANEPSVSACQNFSPPVRVEAGSLGLLVMDTSCASDGANQTCGTAMVQSVATTQFNQINNTLAGPGDDFLLTHDPIWTIENVTPGGNPEWLDQRLAAAVTATTAHMLSSRIRLVLSGHVHLYQMLDFGSLVAPHRPPQITVGSSGTKLDQKTWTDANLIGKNVDGQPVGQLITHSEFGYAVLRDVTGPTWNLRYFDRTGQRVPGTNCSLVGAEFPNCT